MGKSVTHLVDTALSDALELVHLVRLVHTRVDHEMVACHNDLLLPIFYLLLFFKGFFLDHIVS